MKGCHAPAPPPSVPALSGVGSKLQAISFMLTRVRLQFRSWMMTSQGCKPSSVETTIQPTSLETS